MPDLYEIPDLEWKRKDYAYVAETAFGNYYVWHRQGVVLWQFGEEREATAEGVEAAKSAANAHWKARMAGALRPWNPNP